MYTSRTCFRPTHLVNTLRASFQRSLPGNPGRQNYTQVDCILSAFALFHLKYPSLLQFDDARRDEDKCQNIKSLYGLDQVPCDTTMRERLDVLGVAPINQAIHDLIGVMQRSQSLAEWDFLGTKLISLDGTGFFSSATVHCGSCCEKKLKDGSVTYHHQMLVGSVVNPHHKQVLPILFEPICKEDGAVKNDCERNAAKRWLKAYRTLYPNMPTTLVEDG